MITLPDILRARKRISPYINRTPLEKSYFLSDLLGGDVFLKLECYQAVKAYKVRGAFNKLLSIPPSARELAVLAVSSGNHGASVSYAASVLGIENVRIYVPEVTPEAKKEKIRRFGAKLVVEGEDFDETYRVAREHLANSDALWVDPCSDVEVIAGQGTIGLEVLEELPDVDCLLVPVGGGGLITGIGLAIKTISPETQVIGVQTEACPAMLASLRENKFYEQYPSKPSLCDALIGGVGEIPFKLAPRCIDELLIVREETIKRAVGLLVETQKVLVEPSGAVGVACLLEYTEKFRDQRIAVIISGGNIDLTLLKSLL